MGSKELSINNIIENSLLLNKLYDIVRIIDPIRKKVLEYDKDNRVNELDMNCYNFLGLDRVCNNCISARAYNDDDTFVKIEYNGEKVYMFTAVPFNVEGRRVIIELLKDISSTRIIESSTDGKNTLEIYQLLNEKNNLIVKDDLTGAFNKRYIKEKLPYEIVNSTQTNKHLSIIMTDIDYFKKINDTFGHITGDKVLMKFVKELESCIRDDKDWIARYGGDEFLIFLKDADETTAYNIAERMRKKVENMIIKHNDYNINITASFGISTLSKLEVSVDSLIENADKCLYEAKNKGRNKVIISTYKI